MEPIQSTAGAVPVINEKGEVSMQKVKVHRYVCGKRPEYAPPSSGEGESDDEDFLDRSVPLSPPPIDSIDKIPERALVEDPRLRRLVVTRKTEVHSDDEEYDADNRRTRRRRHIQEPEVLEDDEKSKGSSDEDEEMEELSDDEIERRRRTLRQKVLIHKEVQPVEVLAKEDEAIQSSDSEHSDFYEYTDSEEDAGPRLKPIFVRKRDRTTIIEKEKEEAKNKQAEIEAKKKAEERRKETLKIVEEEVKKEQQEKSNNEEANLNDVNTDDENDEVEYEGWKLRELKRLKRDREEREQREREHAEIEKLRNMTEEERRQELKINPKVVTNKSVKGKYKFMQKYFHRGAFYLNEENPLYKRNFAAPTLEDHFEKTTLPKVMQVKNFGRSGRTKYTHLVDQDTTDFDSPWYAENPRSIRNSAKLGK